MATSANTDESDETADEYPDPYPIEAGLLVSRNLRRGEFGKYAQGLAFSYDHGMDNYLRPRYDRVKQDIHNSYDVSSLPVGRIGTVTFYPDDYRIRLDVGDGTQSVGSWHLEHAIAFLRDAREDDLRADRNVDADGVRDALVTLIEASDGRILNFSVECDDCAAEISAVAYISPATDDLLVSCECTNATHAPVEDAREVSPEVFVDG